MRCAMRRVCSPRHFDEIRHETGDDAPRSIPIGDPADYEGMEVAGLGIAAKNLATTLTESLIEEASSRLRPSGSWPARPK